MKNIKYPLQKFWQFFNKVLKVFFWRPLLFRLPVAFHSMTSSNTICCKESKSCECCWMALLRPGQSSLNIRIKDRKSKINDESLSITIKTKTLLVTPSSFSSYMTAQYFPPNTLHLQNTLYNTSFRLCLLFRYRMWKKLSSFVVSKTFQFDVWILSRLEMLCLRVAVAQSF